MKYTVIAMAIFLVAYLGFLQVVYIDYKFINIFTGSTNGHIEVRALGKMKYWHKKSGFEHRLEKINGIQIKGEYVSYAVTGKTLFGIPRPYVHGNPGHAIYLASDSITETINGCSDDEIKELYDINIRKDDKSFNDWLLKIVK